MQSIIGQIILTSIHTVLLLGIRCTCNVLSGSFMVIVSSPGVYGSILGSLSDVYYICHTSIIYWGIPVGYRSVNDYCPYRHRSMIARYRSSKDLTSDARDTGWSTVGRRTRMGGRWAWSMETSENFNFRIFLSNHFLDATLESWWKCVPGWQAVQKGQKQIASTSYT